MGGLFGGKKKSPKPQAVPAPQAIPEVGDEAGEDAVRKAMKRSGFRRTILTGALEPNTGKKTLLG